MNNQPIADNEITQEMLEIMYSQDLDLATDTGEKIEVPADGALGLLALGHRGIIAWRKKRAVQKAITNLDNKTEQK